MGGSPPYSYHWYSSFESFSNPLVEVATSPNFTFTPTSPGVYFIRFSAEDSSGEHTGQFLTPMSVSVSEYSAPSPLPSATISPSPSSTLSPSDSQTQQSPVESTESPSSLGLGAQRSPWENFIPAIMVAVIVAFTIIGSAACFTKLRKKKETT